MSNVVKFQRNGLDGPQSCGPVQATNILADLSELASRLALFQSKAREEMHRAIFLLEVAIQTVRLIANRITDLAARRDIEKQMDTVEHLLELARDKVREL